MSQQEVQELVTGAQQLLATKYFLCAGVTILFYDHLITFSEEVEHVWKKMNGFVSYIFLLNRYYTPLALIVIMIAFFSPIWTREACQKFVIFEPLGVALPLFVISGALLIMRVYAIYGQNILVLLYLSIYPIALIGVTVWEYTIPGWGMVPLPGKADVFQGCLYVPSPTLGNKIGAVFALEITFDVSVFGLIIFRTWYLFRHNTKRSVLFQRILEDGALYFTVIFTSNVIWKFMVLFAPIGLKELLAHPVIVLICTMINRLTISLRVESRARSTQTWSELFSRSGTRDESFLMDKFKRPRPY